MKLFLSLVLIFFTQNAQTQSTSKAKYDTAFNLLSHLVNNSNQVGAFKKSVFLVENVYNEGKLNEEVFIKRIKGLATLASAWLKFNTPFKYHHGDSINFAHNMAIFKILKDSIKLQMSATEIISTLPYTYDFNDFLGHKDWSNMFVTKLLATHKGNCHSLPYLYKILADELGATCWLGFAPNHIYIKNRCQKTGWYNTELTSGDFPTDAWILTSGYIPVDAVRSGIYMDTLSNQQAIAQCVLDLAKGYEFQTKNYEDGFILKCCDLTLKYHPLNVQALLLKAETLKKIYEKHGNVVLEIGNLIFDEMEKLYTKLFELGYREMPDKMYMQWLSSIKKERNKYTNKQLKATLNKR